MYQPFIFSIVLLSQVLLISYFLPRQVPQRLRYVVQNFPPERYPRLYPVALDKVERAQRSYRSLNFFVLVVGLALVAYTLYAPAETRHHLASRLDRLLARPTLTIVPGAAKTVFVHSGARASCSG